MKMDLNITTNYTNGAKNAQLVYMQELVGTEYRPFMAATDTEIRTYKTQRGAEKFLNKLGYVKAEQNDFTPVINLVTKKVKEKTNLHGLRFIEEAFGECYFKAMSSKKEITICHNLKTGITTVLNEEIRIQI